MKQKPETFIDEELLGIKAQRNRREREQVVKTAVAVDKIVKKPTQ